MGAEGQVLGTTISLPFVTARIELHGEPKPYLRAAIGRPRAPQGAWKIGPMTLPSPGKTVYYLGLGALAVVETIEWPIVTAIAAGSYVAQRGRTGLSEASRRATAPRSTV